MLENVPNLDCSMKGAVLYVTVMDISLGEREAQWPSAAAQQSCVFHMGYKITTFRLAVRTIGQLTVCINSHLMQPHLSLLRKHEVQSTRPHTHAPSSSFKAFQMSRGCISLPATELLILFQQDYDSSMNQTLENTTTPFCYQTISKNQTQMEQWGILHPFWVPLL